MFVCKSLCFAFVFGGQSTEYRILVWQLFFLLLFWRSLSFISNIHDYDQSLWFYYFFLFFMTVGAECLTEFIFFFLEFIEVLGSVGLFFISFGEVLLHNISLHIICLLSSETVASCVSISKMLSHKLRWLCLLVVQPSRAFQFRKGLLLQFQDCCCSFNFLLTPSEFLSFTYCIFICGNPCDFLKMFFASSPCSHFLLNPWTY